jgi:(2Fe-2S) ferredoxin
MTKKYQKHIFICINERDENNPKGDCARCGGKDIRLKFVQLINKHGLKGKVRANKSGCLDVCELGAAVVIYPDNIWYTQVTVNDVDEIFETSIIKDGIVERLAATHETWNKLKSIRESKV